MNIRNNLTEIRLKRGIGAAQLAAKVGVSRQTIYAIESSSYLPNTAVSLQLARVLDTSVEEIFQIEAKKSAPADTVEALVLSDPKAMPKGQPLRLCSVNRRVVAVLPDRGNWGMSPTDAILLEPIEDGKHKANARVQTFGDRWNNPMRILIAGCDPSSPILAHALERQGCELVISFENNSSSSLEMLREGMVHVAGTHLLDEVTGKADFLPITQMFPRNSVAVVSYAIWQEGLIVAPGNPKHIVDVQDLLRKDVRFTNRELGSGCRRLLDNLLVRHGIKKEDVPGYDHVTQGHLPAVRRVHAGEADCCIGLQLGARSLGMDFIPLIHKPYNLVIRRKQLELPPVQKLLETLRLRSFRREMEACAGYDMRTAGDRLV